MADEQNQTDPTSSKPSTNLPTSSSRPTITLPARNSAETLFSGGAAFSPGPMTLVSNFFADSDNFKSFSQLLAGAMSSPLAVNANRVSNFGGESLAAAGEFGGDSRNGGGDFQFNQSRPAGLVVAPPPMFMVPSGLSPWTLPDSPGFFSPTQGSFGMSHQQALMQVTAQAAQAQSQSHMHSQAVNSSSFSLAPATSLTQPTSFTTNTTANQQMEVLMQDSRIAEKESSDISHSDHTTQPSNKPADDGYNWRKYGQKHVKGSEYPRSYYKCTHPKCPVKKKVERSLDGQVLEIIYKGQHNHQPPQSKRTKDSANLNAQTNNQRNSEFSSQIQYGNLHKLSDNDRESSQPLAEHQYAASGSEDVGDTETRMDEKDEDEPDPKRRNTEVVRVSEPAASHRAVTEPKIIVQTTSEVDLLDDGYRWRKYGQKVVKGNPYPRSYYKCTTQGCNVRKHVERAATDPKAVITTYEGKHNHDIPAARSSSHSIANSNALQLKSQAPASQTYGGTNRTELGNTGQQQIGRLLLKEEHIS